MQRAARPIKSVLVVEDEELFLQGLCRALELEGYQTFRATNVREAKRQLSSEIDVLIIDIALPDGSGVDVARAAVKLKPAPIIVAVTGYASRRESFELAQVGVTELLEKPFEMDELLETLTRAAKEPPASALHVAPLVGKEPLRSVVDRVRSDMVDEALALTKGNSTQAAKLLGVTRQAIQKKSGKRSPQKSQPRKQATARKTPKKKASKKKAPKKKAPKKRAPKKKAPKKKAPKRKAPRKSPRAAVDR